jgi:glyoxylase-like metal-dependent hydrolase (beta-lactamase superfamily II)
LEDGDRIALGGLELEVLHTPGHTPGSVSLKIDGVVFTGDALFAGGIGRTDFPYGDEEVLMKSISQRLLTLGDGTVIYPGHGEPSTIGEEKRSNPFIT